MKFIKGNFMIFIGIFIGAITGYFIWMMAGCPSGTCMITSSPFISSFYSAVIGGQLANMVRTIISKSDQNV